MTKHKIIYQHQPTLNGVKGFLISYFICIFLVTNYCGMVYRSINITRLTPEMLYHVYIGSFWKFHYDGLQQAVFTKKLVDFLNQTA